MHHDTDSVSVGILMATSLKEAVAEFTSRRDLLRAEAERLSEEAARVEAELKQVDGVLENLERAAALVSDLSFARDPQEAPAGSGPLSEKPRGRELTPDEVIKYTRQVLLDGGRPLKRGAIVRAIEAKSVVVPGADKAKNLGTILWRAGGAFANIRGYGYWPTDVALEDIYKPE